MAVLPRSRACKSDGDVCPDVCHNVDLGVLVFVNVDLVVVLVKQRVFFFKAPIMISINTI